MRVVNTDQEQYWNTEAGAKWVRYQQFLDAQIRPLGHKAMDLAGVAQGEQVLDVGCGCGDTTIELARRVGPEGRVLGIDLSTPMLERARERAEAEDLENVVFVRGDAQTYRFPEGKFHVLFSRFGVMFFSDPVEAFANLRTAACRGARLSFVCWQAVTENPWMAVPMMAVLQHVSGVEVPNPDAPGPFAFANRDKVRGILERAGYQDLVFHDVREELSIGGTEPLEAVVDFLLQMGPAGKLLRTAGSELRQRVATSVTEALQPYATASGIRMPGAAWIVTARVP
jgi:SAM-dependent methyltransferase